MSKYHGSSKYHGYWCQPDEPSSAQIDAYQRRQQRIVAERLATDPTFAAAEAEIVARRQAYFAPMRSELAALTSSGRTRRREAQKICAKYQGGAA